MKTCGSSPRHWRGCASTPTGVVLTPLLAAALISAGDGGFSLGSVGDITVRLLLPFLLGQCVQRWIGLLVKGALFALVTCVFTVASAGAASACAPGDVTINAYNVNNSGEDAGNDSLLEIDRSFNLAKGDGSPGSDIINEVSGASSGMSPASSSGSLTGSSTTVTPGESDDE